MNSLFLPRVIKLGEGCLQEVGKIAEELKATHLFIVTGSLLSKEPFKTMINKSISEHGLKVTYFSECKGEPTTEHLRAALVEQERCGADCVVAIGGGSVIDLAKAVSVFSINKELKFSEIPSKDSLERLPLIAVPTTAGTGSEATKVMVITDVVRNVKLNPGHTSLIPDAAILDPLLTISLPKKITAYTGMDALAHAMEAYVSTKATQLSDFFALEAIKMIGESLPLVYENGHDVKAREKMLLASCYAGIAFSNASTNLAHATARPLGTRYHIPHGLCVALTLPFVIEYGLEVSEERYTRVAKSLGSEVVGSNAEIAADLSRIVREYNSAFHIWEDGMSYIENAEDFKENLPTLITDALAGNGIETNQKVPIATDVEKIYKDLLLELENYARV
ncbi:iron-containing alcohol dehydrogenase [Fredinandcohnia sp. 179-A 10B2 NHS]|uniref:iron-containing alcohol dehydrogenase n=1 Tax=Fredinandcohnia sp. 179-A 10B2 NHS TaxID=3235176 RepID=UPI0039A112BB